MPTTAVAAAAEARPRTASGAAEGILEAWKVAHAGGLEAWKVADEVSVIRRPSGFHRANVGGGGGSDEAWTVARDPWEFRPA